VIRTGTEVFYGVDTVMNKVLQFLYQTRDRIDACVDYTRPSLAIDIEILKKAFLDAKKRDVKLRYITEITENNISYCKQMMMMVDELRHLDGIKGNFYVSGTGYLAPATFHEAGVPAAQIIYSNAKELIEHQKYIFETLWSKTIPAEQRIREIEEGSIRYETRIIDNSEQIINEISSLTANSNELDACLTSGGMHYSHKYFFDIKKNLLERQKIGGHKGIRYVTNINNENAKLTKLYLDSGIQIKHLNNLPPLSFGVSDKEMAVTIEKMEEGKVVQSLLVSNEPKYLKHFSALFQELWENGIDAIERIREIEEGAEPSKIEIIRNPKETVTLSHDLVKSAKHEILRIYPSINQFHRQVRIGVLHLFREAMERGLSVKVLVPGDAEQINKIINEVQLALPNLDIRSLDKSLQTQIGILVVDRKESVIIELKDDTKDNYYDAAGLAAHSNSKPIGISYASIFETLWKQGELYEQLQSSLKKLEQKEKELNESNNELESANELLKLHDRMQKEFINIASHEMKTPTQAILGTSGLLQYYPERRDELIEIIRRNAKRLQALTSDILDVTRIESQTFQLQKERFNIYDLLSEVIKDYTERTKSENKSVKLSYMQQNANHHALVEADKGRITQVLSNVLNNALKFTDKGEIVVEAHESNNKKEIIVSITDTGSGINKDIFSKLFSKFVTKSSQGTGLGLYISKSIIEAHGGRIWAENRKDKTGSIFIFTLPRVNEDLAG
jgi:two-component system, OmpR family, sensor histidine kinase VicK